MNESFNEKNPAGAKLLSLSMEGPLSDRTEYGWPKWQWPDQEPGEDEAAYADRVEAYVEAYHKEVKRRMKAGLLRTDTGEVLRDDIEA